MREGAHFEDLTNQLIQELSVLGIANGYGGQDIAAQWISNLSIMLQNNREKHVNVRMAFYTLFHEKP